MGAAVINVLTVKVKGDPDAYLEIFREAGADSLTVHYEACVHLHRTVHRIKELGARAGVSINPATPVSHLHQIIQYVDLVLIMSVNPGFGGQSFIPASVERIREALDLIRRANRPIDLEVDGGIDARTAPLVVAAGANVLVSGNFVFRSGYIAGAIRALKESDRSVSRPAGA